MRRGHGAQGQNRTADTAIFSRMLYQLSYLGHRVGCQNMRMRERFVVGDLVACSQRLFARKTAREGAWRFTALRRLIDVRGPECVRVDTRLRQQGKPTRRPAGKDEFRSEFGIPAAPAGPCLTQRAATGRPRRCLT
jgi:hypothetical protein